jgi:hypothetical protein
VDLVPVNPRHLEQDLTSVPAPELARLLPEGVVLPQYEGRSLLNLPATIGETLGVTDGWVAPPLEQAIQPHNIGDVERVLFLLLDGLGWRRLWQVVEQEDTAFEELLDRQGARVAPITSTAPSTTSVATTAIWGNGAAPAEQGMLGYTFLLAEQAALCNLLFWKPVGRGNAGYGELESWGVKPETFLPAPSIAQVLAAGGVPTTALMPAAIASSPLSRAQMRGARIHRYLNATDLWLKATAWLENNQQRRAYCYAYFPDFDMFSHRDGPNDTSWLALWRAFRFHLDAFLERLPAASRARTLLILAADHGHVPSPVVKQHVIQQHPNLMRHLMLLPGGEPRHCYLYARAGHQEAIREYYDNFLAADFYLLNAMEALHGGLYGPPERLHPDVERRIGDFVLLSRHEATLWAEVPEQPLLGMHGALEPEEMLVPFIALRLDA